ncbi:MAG: hypothetical protein JW787_03435 [Sedimentisphaerales bacterium]|nr:hypothetical protein [Sedimentisphaerales bacterium]
MIYLVHSLDYELFGNGSGDVRRDMIEPTNRLLAICNKHNAKVTIMFEAGAYWAMKRAEELGTFQIDYSPSREIEAQIQFAVKYGHDVQLHLHPWWIGAAFQAGRWNLNPNCVRISDLPNGIGSDDDVFSVIGVLSRGKRTLEGMICPSRPDYKCLVYRAGAFCGQPSKDLILGMKKAGLAADSSVVKGLYEKLPVTTDYRQAESTTQYWWTSEDDISQAGIKGEHIIEFQVCSEMQPYLYNFKWTKLHTSIKRKLVERANTHGYGMTQARFSSMPVGRILRELFTMYPFKYDFCKLGYGDMIRRLKRLISDDQKTANGFGTPVVMIGHSKDFWNDRNLDKFLGFINDNHKEKVCFSTLGDLTRMIINRDIQSDNTQTR